MIKRIKHGFKIFFTIVRVIYVLYKEKKWPAKQISKFEELFEGKLSKTSSERNIKSYCVAIPLLIDPFTQLEGRNSNQGEKERFFMYLLCSSIFDDFFDKKNISPEDLNQIFFQPFEYSPKNFEERAFLHSHISLLNYVKNLESYKALNKELYDFQIDSYKQLDPLIDKEELKRITIGKGGISNMMIFYFLDMDQSLLNQTCWKQFGYILQIMDDLLDIMDDLKEGVYTLPMIIKDAHELDFFFDGLMKDLKLTIFNLPYPKKRKEKLIISWVAICSICKLALKQLVEVQDEHGHLPDLKTLPRNKIVVDMQKTKNLQYCIKFTYRETYNWLHKS